MMSPRDNYYRKSQRTVQGGGQEASEEAFEKLLQNHRSLMKNGISAAQFLQIDFKMGYEKDDTFIGFSYTGNSSNNCQNNGWCQGACSVIDESTACLS